ncbi:nucleolar protein 3 isoform X5 [Canis lupus baileyi]
MQPLGPERSETELAVKGLNSPGPGLARGHSNLRNSGAFGVTSSSTMQLLCDPGDPRRSLRRRQKRPERQDKSCAEELFRCLRGAPAMGNAQERPSETIDRERKRLVETLQADSGLLLDALLARGVLAGPEYEALDALPDAERRVRRLLLLVQSKGEAACQELLLCAQRTARAPDPAWDWQHVGTGYRERSWDAACAGHWTPEAPGSSTTCPELPRAADCGEPGAPGGSEAAQSGSLEEPDPELEAGAELESEPQMDLEPEPEAEPEPELEREPEPEPEPDLEAGDESEDS